MKKRLVVLFFVIASLLLASIPVCAASGSLSVSGSTQSVTVGSTVTVTIQYNGNKNEIASILSRITYNAKAFNYDTASFKGTDGASANGSAGVIIGMFEMPASGVLPTAVSMSMTFKAIAVGELNLSVETQEFTSNTDYSSLGTPSKSLSVSAINPTKSANADLSALKPSSGTLTPKFSAKTTEYTITVPYTTTTLNLSATTAHKEAKVAISGSNSLQVGKNTRVITVTAANGTTKKYTVVITRSANQTTDNQNTTTTTAPEKELLEVEVDGKLMTVSDTQKAIDLPAGFVWDTATVNNMLVSAAKHEKSGMVLLHLIPADSKEGSFYIYYQNEGQFAPFRPYAVSGGQYVLLDMPAGQAAPLGTKRDMLHYEGGSVSAFVYEDTAQADFTIVYAVSPAGVTGLYVHDRTDGSLQRYREVELPADLLMEEPTEPNGGLPAFLAAYKTTLLMVAAVCGGLLLVAGAVVLLIVLKKRHFGSKH